MRYPRSTGKQASENARRHNYINIRGKTGSINVKFESVPFPGNTKTAMLTRHNALAAFKQFNSPVLYGTRDGNLQRRRPRLRYILQLAPGIP